MNYLNPFRSSPPEPPLSAEAARRLVTGGARDPTRFLPKQAAEKLELLRYETEQVKAVSSGLSDTMHDLQDQIWRHEIYRRQLECGAQTQNNRALLQATLDEISCLKEKRAEAQRRCEGQSEIRGHALMLLNRLETHCLRLKEPVALAPPVSTLPSKNGDYSLAVSAARNKVEKHKAELQSAIDAPVPSTEAKKAALEQLSQMAARGAVNVMPLIESGRPAAFPGQHPYSTVADVTDFLAWLLQDVLTARLESEIDYYSDDNSALTPQQRKTKIAGAKAAILQAEREEESIVEAGRAAGQVIARRADCDPRAVLALADRCPEPSE